MNLGEAATNVMLVESRESRVQSPDRKAETANSQQCFGLFENNNE